MNAKWWILGAELLIGVLLMVTLGVRAPFGAGGILIVPLVLIMALTSVIWDLVVSVKKGEKIIFARRSDIIALLIFAAVVGAYFLFLRP